MSMSALVRALGAAAGGVSKGMDEAEAAAERKRKREQEDQDRAYLMSERARTTAERDRADKLRVDMGNASMPTTVEAAPVAMPIGSRDEPRAPEDVGIRAAGQTFTDRGEADKAAAAYNTPQAMASRQAQVAASAGDPHAAQQLRTGAMQEQAAKLQLSAAERAELDARFNSDLQAKVNSWETLDQFISDSAGDGQGGAAKYTSVPSPDGKTRVLNRIGPDGAMVPTGQAFPNTADGLQLAMGELSKLSPEKKLAHLHQKAVLARQEARDAQDGQYQQGMLQNAQDKTAAGIEIAQIRADAAAQGRALRLAQASAPAGIDMAGADKFINELFSNKDQMTGAATFDPVGADAVRGLMLGMPSAKNGDTQGAVNQALMVYNRYLKMAGGDQAKALEFIRQARSAPAAPAPGGGQTAAAPAEKRVKQAPVVDFNPGSGPKRRMSEAASKLPKLEAAVAAATEKVRAAASGGPMAVAAARNELSNAKTALAEMSTRAGN